MDYRYKCVIEIVNVVNIECSGKKIRNRKTINTTILYGYYVSTLIKDFNAEMKHYKSRKCEIKIKLYKRNEHSLKWEELEWNMN